MILGPKTLDYRTIQALSAAWLAPFPLYIDGSRYYGTAHDKSDWDLTGEYSKVVVDYFVDRGWKEVDSDKRLDSNTAAILYKGRVQIMLAHSLYDRLAVRSHVRSHYGSPPKGDVDFWESQYTKHYAKYR